MDIATIGGIGGSFAIIIIAIIISGNPLTLYADAPSFMIVVIGSFFAMVAGVPLSRSLGIMKYIRIILNVPRYNTQAIIDQLVGFADTARKEGLLSLDDSLNDVSDDFMRSGLRLVVDGTDADIIKKILNTNIAQLEARHEDGIAFFSDWALIAPALGMVGTLLGLIGMMTNLEDTASVGPNMAVALITTLYGSMFANMILTPIKLKLTDRNNEELMVKSIVINGVLSIQAGDNPRVLEDKLNTYLPPGDRKGAEDASGDE